MLFLRRKIGDRVDTTHNRSGDTFMCWVESIKEGPDGRMEVTLALADSLHNFTFSRHDRRPKPAKEAD